MLKRLLRLETRTLLILAAAGAAVWAFLNISDEVGERETLPIDTRLLLMLRNPANPDDPIGSRSVEEAMRDVTALGGFTVLTLIVVIAVAALWSYGRRREAAVFAATVILAQVSAEILKAIYAVPRPDLVPHGSYVYSHSFPSGHSALSAVTFLSLAAILASLQARRRAKVFIFTVAILLTLAVGFSRVYLGVHWPSDVLGGWTLGAAWALAARLVLGWWKREAPTA